jgi:hypothetical protein
VSTKVLSIVHSVTGRLDCAAEGESLLEKGEGSPMLTGIDIMDFDVGVADGVFV